MPNKIVIVRHGQTEYNQKNILQGQLHVPLDNIGIVQAHKTGERLRHEKFDAIFASDLKRTVQTVDIIAKKMNDIVHLHADLRERGLGHLEGKQKDVAFKELGVEKDGFPLHHFWNFQEEEKHNSLNLESKEALFKRVKNFVHTLQKDFKDKNVLVVSHGGTIRVLLHHLGFTDHDFLKKIVIKNAAILHLTKKGDKYDLKIDDEHV